MTPRVDSTMTLRDGRRLAYAEWGDADGRPVLFFHGTPSCRLFHPPDPSAFDGLRTRWISVDRPGYGRSDHQARRDLLGWTRDVEALANHLGLAEFSVAGLSGGGPHALACAFALPARVRRTAVVSGVGPVTPETLRQMFPERRWGFRLSRTVPWLVPFLVRLVGDPRRVDRHYAKVLAQCRSDRQVLERPAVRDMLQANWAEANRQGLRAYAADGRIFALPWPFEPSAIRGMVRFWHGTADESVPVEMARTLSNAIPNATLEIVPGAGHFLVFDHLGAIVRWVVGDAE
ncbi:MAG: alpha/beta hydrolase [Polyangiaceae bacterium]|nr:alpha/beta hydrolase [Polyangiaceae bacterium]